MMRTKEFIFEESNQWELLISANDKSHWASNLVKLVQNAYSVTNLGSFIKSVSDVKSSDWLILDWDENNVQESAIFYRGPRAADNWSGHKIQGIGHDGRRESKTKVINKVKELLSQNGWWIESSHAMAAVLANIGLRAIVDESKLQNLFSDPTLKLISNNGTYVRKLSSGQLIQEIVYGNPIIKQVRNIKESNTARTDTLGNVYDFHWQEEPMGFYVTVNNKPIENGFFSAKSLFDRSGAQEQARKLVVTLYSDSVTAQRTKEQHRYQYEKPLSELEQEWAEMTNRFMTLNDAELARWSQLGHSLAIRKSLIDGSHPAVKKP